jgi:CRISPR-associated exonuclease Cas4
MEDDGFLRLSILQHWLFCPRQAALILVEQQWTENQFTAEGRVLHEKADKPARQSRKGVRTLTALPLRSEQLRIYGVADVVELCDGQPFPVEYKRGRPKKHRADEVQLCAQAICLEEAFDTTILAGALFYGQTRRRKDILFDHELRRLTYDVAEQAHGTLGSGLTPRPVYEPRKCDSCSMLSHCKPKIFEKQINVEHWMRRQMEKNP